MDGLQRSPGRPLAFSVCSPSPFILTFLKMQNTNTKIPWLTFWLFCLVPLSLLPDCPDLSVTDKLIIFHPRKNLDAEQSPQNAHWPPHRANLKHEKAQIIVYETDSRLSDKKKEIRKIPKRSVLKTRVQKDFCIVLMPPNCKFWHFMILYIVNIIDK